MGSAGGSIDSKTHYKEVGEAALFQNNRSNYCILELGGQHQQCEVHHHMECCGGAKFCPYD